MGFFGRGGGGGGSSNGGGGVLGAMAEAYVENVQACVETGTAVAEAYVEAGREAVEHVAEAVTGGGSNGGDTSAIGETITEEEKTSLASELVDPDPKARRTFNETHGALVYTQPLPADYYGPEGTKPPSPMIGEPGYKEAL